MAFLARQLWREVAGSGGKTRPASRALSYLATWGNGDLGRLGHGEACENVEVPVVCSRGLEGAMASRVSCGGAHTLVLDQRGRVFSMGLNDSGQLGLGVNEEYVTEPTLVPGLEGKTVTDIAAGRDHSAVVTSEGEVFVAGSNKKGKLGLGKRSPRMASTFQKNDFLADYRIEKVALGAMHSLCLSSSGEVFSWGSSAYGVLGHGMTKRLVFISSKDEWSPRKILFFEENSIKVSSVASGDSYSGCVDSRGNVYTWGQGSFWKLGHERDVDAWKPQAVADLAYVKKIALGFSHSMALTRHGQVYVWGANQNGCLGTGKKKTSNLRSPVKLEIDHEVADICCGFKHSAAVTSDGRVLAWGWGGSMGTSSTFDSGGQLGQGNAFDYWEPTSCRDPVAAGKDLPKVAADTVSCGFNHTAAVYA